MTEESKFPNPFTGKLRRRLPCMHAITACEGGAELENYLAGYIFAMLHEKVAHTCCVAEHAKSMDAQRPHALSNPVAAVMPSGDFFLALQEWSYLPDKEAFVFQVIASSFVEQVQRWIAEGSKKPYESPAYGGSLLLRPAWAEAEFGTPDSSHRSEARAIILKLEAEVAADRATAEAEERTKD